MLIPDAAHGTNPASAAMAGFKTLPVKSTPDGFVDVDDLAAKLNAETAVFMITNPNTLGLFERRMGQIAEMVHKAGRAGLSGRGQHERHSGHRPARRFRRRPDALQPAQDLQRPARRRRTGRGPDRRGRKARPVPARAAGRQGRPRLPPRLPTAPSRSAGCGAFSAASACWCGCTATSARTARKGCGGSPKTPCLNANYLLSQVKDTLPVPNGDRCMHEFVASAGKLKSERGIAAMDIAKRLLDYGFHAPTVYFPLIVREAMMIEPTETESKATLDAFAEALKQIVAEPAEMLHGAPQNSPICRPDEVLAARKPVLRWKAEG